MLSWPGLYAGDFKLLNSGEKNLAHIKIDIPRYDLAEFPDVWAHVSPWCAVFSEENLKILEFTDDLSFYYKDGYGYDINWQMTKPLVDELQLRFQELR